MIENDLVPQTATANRPKWATDLVPGHVVVMTVPTRGRRRPDPQPYLTLEVREYADEPAAILAPLLPATGGRTGRRDIYLTADDLVGVRGLHRPHQCLTGHRLIVPLTHAGLAEAAHDGTPLLGLLAYPVLRRVHRARVILGAERALADQARRSRYLAGRDAVRDKTFTVEARHPTRPALRVVPTPPTQSNEEGRT